MVRENSCDRNLEKLGRALSDRHCTLEVKEGKRYRLAFLDASGEAHPAHLHRHSFEIVGIAGKPISGVLKDVVSLEPYGRVEVDFITNNPGLTLFHCHQQLHMDDGFMLLIKYV